MINKYLIVLPKVQGSVTDEWRQCLEQIGNVRQPGQVTAKLNIFTDIIDYPEYIKVSREIKDSLFEHFPHHCPALNVTVHLPEKPWKVAVEVGFMDSASCEIKSKLWHNTPYIIRISDTTKEVWAGGLGEGMFPDNTRKAANAAFDQMRAILEAEQMSFDHIVRQWNFIGNILMVRNELQNYQIFNEVRSENYHKFRKIHSYPAATGVGMKYDGVKLDFCAVKATGDLKIIAVDNPDQIRPYDYSQQVLKGKPVGGKGINQPPQFERAVFIAENYGSTLFVSGTASIIGQDTIGIDNVEKQTIVTLENINKLADARRIEHLTGNTDTHAVTPILLRVYIKKQSDFAKVKAICSEQYPAVPSIYIEADICRDNLLVEIEAEFSKTD
jgi:enamine deaminase RidA (YjgF/YER057c/UK114 family)